jgi:hypothetical protein
MTKIHVSETMLSDMYKDAHGFRPRGHYKQWWTKDELEKEYDWLQKLILESMDREKARQDIAEKEFEKLVQETIDSGAGDRDTAIRWLMQAEDIDTRYSQEVEGFFWSMGLSYQLYIKYGKQYSN